MAPITTVTTADIDTYEGMDHIRLAPSMWLGDTIRTTAAREIVDNAVDEIVRGYASTVTLLFHSDGSLEVRDDGRGLPVDFKAKENKNGIVLTLGTAMSGSNFRAEGAATAGTHGVGASGTNAISRRFDVTVFQNGKCYRQCFKEGKPGHFDSDDFDPDAPFTLAEGEKLKGQKIPPGFPEHGTWVRFFFDPTIDSDDELDREMLIFRAKMMCYLTPGMTLVIAKDGDDDDAVQTYSFADSGAHTALEQVTGQTAMIRLDGDFTFGAENRAASYDLALTPADEQRHVAATNGVYTPDGGSHVDPVFKAVGEALSSKQLRGLKRGVGEPYPSAADFAATCSMAINFRMKNARYTSQEKRALQSNRVLSNALRKELTHKLTIWAASPANSASLTTWAERALEHARTVRKIEDVRKAARDKRNKAGQGTNLSLPEKLLPCKETGRGSGAELFICEGDSALGTVKDSRYSSFQAAYPLRGKPINSYGMLLGSSGGAGKSGGRKTLRSNEEYRALEAIIGCGVREACDPENSRYDRIIFATDADVDGYNISALLLQMFWDSYKPLLDEGMIYIAVPPLFIVTTDKDERIYCVTEDDRDETISELKAKGRKKIEIQRCKGLGEMDPPDFRKTVMNPETRTLIQITVDEDAEGNLAVQFGPDAQPRRDWIDKMRSRGLTETVDVSN